MTYDGGKNGAGVYQTIINQMPPHRVYIESFLGSGAILRRKRPAEENYGIELTRFNSLQCRRKSPRTRCSYCSINWARGGNRQGSALCEYCYNFEG